jgi:hypothetical protein
MEQSDTIIVAPMREAMLVPDLAVSYPAFRSAYAGYLVCIVVVVTFACAAMFPVHTQSERFGGWEVETPPGSDPLEALRASEALASSDLRMIEYFPKLSVICERGTAGPYGRGRMSYKALKIEIHWFAQNLPKSFDVLATFVRTGIDSRAADPKGNTIWVNYGRAWTSGGGFSDLIKIGDDDSSPVETVKITGILKGFRLAAEVLDSGAAEAFLKAWNPIGKIPVILQDAQGHDLGRKVELFGMKPAVDSVLAYCGRNPL